MSAKEEFIAKVELIYSIYRDCRNAFVLTLKDFKQQQETMLKEFESQGKHWTIEDLDKKKYHYGVREGKSGKISSAASFTQGEWKEKIGENGSNVNHIGNICLVMIYQYWEDKYREEIAISKGMNNGELNSNLFGDIRYLRNSIIHNNGRANDDVDKCKILRWFRANDQIIIDANKMDLLIAYIKDEINAL
jgi:hypothetical protein